MLNSVERKLIIILGDAAIILFALTLFVNDALDVKIEVALHRYIFYGLGVVFYLILAYVFDFYNLDKALKTRAILSQSFVIVVSFCFFVFLGTVIVFDASFWRMPLLIFLTLTPVEIFLWRFLFRNLFRVIPITKNVGYIYDGDSDKQEKFISQINGDGLQTFYKTKLTLAHDSLEVMGKKKFVNALNKVDTLILNLKNYDKIHPRLEALIINAILRGKEVISFTTFYETTYEALPIRSHNDSFYEILQFRSRRIRYLQRVFSFFVNFFLSLVIGPIFIASIPFVFTLNLFFNRGPLFYTQKRVGLHGKEFKIYKFRSMVKNAEQNGVVMATKNDQRITPFGKILRVFRVDELPQIISVVRGDMQFIGPRPERKYFVNQINEIIPFYNARHLIKPGITGWAQVKYKYGENLEDSIRKLEYDLYYIKNRSTSLDLRIIFKTVTTILFSRGV